MYYQTSDARNEAHDEPNNADFKQNPNKIVTQHLVFTLPRFPKEATNKEATDFGPMGVSVNSVAFYNQNAAPGDDILEELNTFDQYEGHPQQRGQYHYHLEPTWLTGTLGDDKFMGLLLDGFPVYGPVENGIRLTNDDLDDYHGHTSATAEFPEGIYHYHITDELPWINGDGYYGKAGTLTQYYFMRRSAVLLVLFGTLWACEPSSLDPVVAEYHLPQISATKFPLTIPIYQKMLLELCYLKGLSIPAL